jgi:hypothetical protein
VSSQQTERLKIILVNEGMALLRSFFYTYLVALFGGGGGSLDKCKFIARLYSPDGTYDLYSKSFLQPLTLASFDDRGVRIEKTQEAKDALDELRKLIESDGWREEKTTGSRSPWYNYSYQHPLGARAVFDLSRPERSRSRPTGSLQKKVFWVLAVVAVGMGALVLVPWLLPTPRGAPPPTTAGNMLLSQGQPIVASSHATPTPTATPTAGPRQWATAATASSEYSNPKWSAMEATGAPNTTSCADNATAWAPRSDGISPEWIELEYSTPVQATMLRVHETYNSGFIFQVDLKDSSGNLHRVWTGTDTTSCPGWFEITLPKTSFLVEGVRIHTRISGWEEIDAVELIGEPGVQISTPIPTTPRPAVTSIPSGPSTPKPTPIVEALRIEAGSSSQYADTAGNVWRADRGFLDGNTVDRGAIEIANTQDDRVYQTERYGMSGYAVNLANGSYTVRLHFAETYSGITGPGQRVFSVNVEGIAINNLDIFAEAGGRNRALVKTVVVQVTDGQLNLGFIPAVQKPEINGIEILAR